MSQHHAFGTSTTVKGVAASERNAIAGGPFGSDLVSSDYTTHGVPVIRGTNMNRRYVGGSFVFVSPAKADTLSRNTARPGDLVFTQRGTLGQVALVPDAPYSRYLLSQSQMKLTPDPDQADTNYLYYWFTSPNLQHHIVSSAIQTGVPHTNLAILQSYPVTLPPLSEQRKIVAILSTWDQAIELTERLIAAKQQRRTGLMQQLLTGKIRFGTDDPEYRSVTVGEVVEKLATAIEVEPTATYREIGIRSHGKGIFHKEPVLGAVIGEKRVYKVKPDCLTFNIVFAWEQAIAVTTANEEEFVCSHRFPMFKPKASVADPKYLLAFFLSPKGTEMLELASPGGAGRNRTLGQSAFLKLKVPLPNVEFQKRFVCLIDTLDSELSLLAQKLDALRRQKKGLMQQLLTGRVRVRVDEPPGV